MAVTVKQIAELANVSRGTVDRVLNNRSGVSEATRQKVLKIAEEQNITHAAEKLFITQSALNQQLLKLEKELGTPLFYRSRTDWHPTPAGEIYLNAENLYHPGDR